MGVWGVAATPCLVSLKSLWGRKQGEAGKVRGPDCKRPFVLCSKENELDPEKSRELMKVT